MTARVFETYRPAVVAKLAAQAPKDAAASTMRPAADLAIQTE